MALYVTPSSCPASPAESFEKPHPASAIQVVKLGGSTAESIVARDKISTTIGHYVRGFQGCQAVSNLLTLFSLEIYSLSKTSKNKANLLYSKVPRPPKSLSVRAEKSRLVAKGSGFRVQGSVTWLEL